MELLGRRDLFVRTGILTALGLTATSVLADDEDDKPKKEKKKGEVGLMPPHWMDELIGESDDAETIIKKLSESSQFEAVVDKSIKLAKKEVEGRPADFVGPSYAQLVRMNIIKGLRTPGFVGKKGKKKNAST